MPGEILVTSYPAGHWAAVSGTSFSAGLTSGAVALMQQVYPKLAHSDAVNDIGTGARPVSGFEDGRVELPLAVATSARRR